MQKMFAIIWKDIRLRFSSPSEWLFFLILPIAFTVILAGGTGGSEEDSRARLLVVDEAQSTLSAELLEQLSASTVVRPDVQAHAEAEGQFADGEADALLIIPPSFAVDSVQGGGVSLNLRLLPNSTSALAAQQAVSAAITRVSSPIQIAAGSAAEAERIRPFASDAERATYKERVLQAAREELTTTPDRLVETQANTDDPVDYDPQANSSAGQMITWVFIPLLGISGTFIYERQIGTLRRMFVTPTEKSLYLFSTILGQVLLAVVQMALLVGFGAFVMHIDWGHSVSGLALLMVSSALAAAGLGTAMGAFIKTPGQAGGLSVMSGMLMALLGGCWYPIELFPTSVQTITKVLPTRWAMQGILDLAVREQGFTAVLPEIAVLIGFAMVFFAVGLWRFRYE